MAVDKDHFIQIFDNLPMSAQQSAYDFMKFLLANNTDSNWDDIMKLEPDNEPLNTEEQQQLTENNSFMSWEDAMDELGLSTDTKP